MGALVHLLLVLFVFVVLLNLYAKVCDPYAVEIASGCRALGSRLVRKKGQRSKACDGVSRTGRMETRSEYTSEAKDGPVAIKAALSSTAQSAASEVKNVVMLLARPLLNLIDVIGKDGLRAAVQNTSLLVRCSMSAVILVYLALFVVVSATALGIFLAVAALLLTVPVLVIAFVTALVLGAALFISVGVMFWLIVGSLFVSQAYRVVSMLLDVVRDNTSAGVKHE
ncbi:hypothetical protein FVE85_0549 [Porphyridium purpureum]|uniref:Uncharacterized protein n=1 Tax=Porphyridium purpureum TaxID=35688 RepID=A0A5J4Z0N8_PORPP|nr:hypothetical protein FVE85_0549 [Porphyridium purpureum]|eukprot:POR7201..scf208_2